MVGHFIGNLIFNFEAIYVSYLGGQPWTSNWVWAWGLVLNLVGYGQVWIGQWLIPSNWTKGTLRGGFVIIPKGEAFSHFQKKADLEARGTYLGKLALFNQAITWAIGKIILTNPLKFWARAWWGYYNFWGLNRGTLGTQDFKKGVSLLP